MIHLDLFSGIGGFSLAFDNVFHEQKNTHIFCEIDPFCKAVLRKHWPESIIIDDVRVIADARSSKSRRLSSDARKTLYAAGISDQPFLLTGGFPCQPFSQAGRRKGTEDDRHLWPFMFEAIRGWQPAWVIAENVRGLLTQDGGMVFEQVCADMESIGYQVQTFVIPAVAVDAPHRIWFVAHRKGLGKRKSPKQANTITDSRKARPKSGSGDRDDDDSKDSERIRFGGRSDGDPERNEREIQASGYYSSLHKNDADSGDKRLQRRGEAGPRHRGQPDRIWSYQRPDWGKNWLEVATRLCRVDDGLPRRMDRNPRLKALGNAIVPQVAEEIMKAIKSSTW